MVTINVRAGEKVKEEKALFVSFNYNADLVAFMKSFSVAYYHADTKEWEIPFKQLQRLVKGLQGYKVTVCTDNAEYLVEKHYSPLKYDFKTTPFQHQIEGFQYGMENNTWLLGDEQGLGKTKQVIDIACARKAENGYQHCLIICGVNGLKWNWVNEIATHSNEQGWIIGQQTKNGKTTIGSNNEKVRQLDMLEGGAEDISNAYFIITNVESLRDEQIAERLARLCKTGVIGMIAADEVHKMKNPQSQQGKGFLKLHSDTMIALTGTPLMNTPLDLYIILKWLGYESHSFYAFKNHYCEMGGYGNYQIVGYKHLDDLQEQLNDIMLRRLKSDVLDLPEKTFVDEYVELTAKQVQLYKEVLNDIMANIDRVKAAVNPLAEMIRLRQVTGYTGILSSAIQESAKLDRMEELVADAVENGKKVVIFSNWTQMTDVIFERLSDVRKYNFDLALITGDTADADRQAIVNRFQQDDECKVIIGTVGAMGTGLTLTAGTVEIFVDEPWTMAAKEQAIDRCHRIGQQNNITIYTLLTKNTIDERIHEIVQKKGALASAMVDGAGVTDKGALVDYLLS